MRSDQRALRLEVKKQIIKYLDSDLFVLIWPRMECIKQTLASKSPESVKAMDQCALHVRILFTYKKTLHQLPQNQIFFLM